MKLSYDPAKSDRNERDRRLSFERARNFDFKTAKFWEDHRQNYPETRYVALGYLDEKLHVFVFGETEDAIRIISCRKANDREGKRHGFAQKRD